MGSCCSSSSHPDSTLKLDQHSSMAVRRASRSEDRSPTFESRAPPPTLDEETVKEVVLSVSESPKLKLPKKPKHEQQQNQPENKIAMTALSPVSPIDDEKRLGRSPADEISDASEVETVSTTTNVTNDDNDDEIGRARVYRSPIKRQKNRSFSGDLVAGAGRRERLVQARSPSRRSEQSPGRKVGNGVGSVRIVQSRDPGRVGSQNRLSPATEKRFGRDGGEGSGRRSRSPAMSRGDNGGSRSVSGRSPTARRVGRSPGRVVGSPNEKDCLRNHSNDESFDNPLVSLECFIFL